jgi:hypothetical protein
LTALETPKMPPPTTTTVEMEEDDVIEVSFTGLTLN